MRANDIVGQLGGEEFVALLPGTLADAATAAERVRAAFATASLVRSGQHVATTVSIGVSQQITIDGHRPDHLARRHGALSRQEQWPRPRRDRHAEEVLSRARGLRRSGRTERNDPAQQPGKRKERRNRRRPATLHRLKAMPGEAASFCATPNNTFRTRRDAACA